MYQEEFPLKRYTMEDINSMLDAAEADFAAGRFIDDDDAWDELEEVLAQEKVAFWDYNKVTPTGAGM